MKKLYMVTGYSSVEVKFFTPLYLNPDDSDEEKEKVIAELKEKYGNEFKFKIEATATNHMYYNCNNTKSQIQMKVSESIQVSRQVVETFNVHLTDPLSNKDKRVLAIATHTVDMEDNGLKTYTTVQWTMTDLDTYEYIDSESPIYNAIVDWFAV